MDKNKKSELNIHHPHDKLVAKLLEDKAVAVDLLKSHLPAKYVKELDFGTLESSSETSVSERWKKYHNDIVFHCRTKTKKDTYIYLLLEHQSTPDVLMPIRLLRYKLNVLSKYLDAKSPPKELPNILSLVMYHGEKVYPYATDVFSCFKDKKLAEEDLLAPMNMIDLTAMSEEALLRYGGADALLKLLLKFSREKDFIGKMCDLMESSPGIFIYLSVKQASFVLEYMLHLGKGTTKNAEVMKTAINKIYGQEKAKKVFTLADYFREEAKQEGIKLGEERGEQRGWICSNCAQRKDRL